MESRLGEPLPSVPSPRLVPTESAAPISEAEDPLAIPEFLARVETVQERPESCCGLAKPIAARAIELPDAPPHAPSVRPSADLSDQCDPRIFPSLASPPVAFIGVQ
jgi:hypothetical protein